MGFNSGFKGLIREEWNVCDTQQKWIIRKCV